MAVHPELLGGLRILIGLVSLGFLWVSYRSREQPGRFGFGIFVLGAAVWSFAAAADVLNPNYPVSRSAYNFLLGASQLVAGGWFLLAVEVTQQRRIRRRFVGALGGWILVFQLLSWTNKSHWLVLGPDTTYDGVVLIPQYAIGFWIHAVVAYVLVIGGTLLLAHEALVSHGLRRKQTTILTLAIVPAISANLISLFDLWFNPYDLAPFGFVVTIGLLAFAVFRWGFLDLIPIAIRTAFEETSDGFVLLDSYARVVDCNDAARRLFDVEEAGIGLSTAEFFGNTTVELTASDNVQMLSVSTGDGDRYYEISTTPIGAGDPDGWVVMTHDVTDQRQREESLRDKNERLDEFASVVAHDLRNPLGIAQGHLELLALEDDSEHLSTAKNALNRMDTILEDMLGLAKAGKDLGAIEQVRLDDAIERCLANVETESASVAVETEMTIMADRGRLEQLLENLLRNAVEHGGEEVEIRVGKLSNGFYFDDDGPGIATKDRERVFEPGYTTAENGTGFGLSIVREIATAHDWAVSLHEGESGGARFEFHGVHMVG